MNTASSHKRILILGGYGSFGARLSRLLTQHTTHLIVVAGRSLSAAQKHCNEFGGIPAELNRRTITDRDLQKISVDILVDATGPFSIDEADPYRVASACLKANAHYIDLSDDGDFTCGITQFHAAAVSRGLLVTSGASTVPSISAAIVRSLTEDIAQVEYIETSILPGNRAPRGLSLMKSILHQTGRPSYQNLARWCRNKHPRLVRPSP